MNNTNVCMRARSPVQPHPFYLVVEESNMKRGCKATERGDLGPNKKPSRRQVTLTTFKKWQVQLEREHQTMTWLRCDTDQNNPTVVDSELVFSLPFSNGQVERIFSMMIIKTEGRTSLHNGTLSDLLEIQVEGPPLAAFSPDRAVKLWWDDCKTTRRVNQAPRKEYRPRATSTELSSYGPSYSEASSDSTEDTLSLDDWDDF